MAIGYGRKCRSLSSSREIGRKHAANRQYVIWQRRLGEEKSSAIGVAESMYQLL